MAMFIFVMVCTHLLMCAGKVSKHTTS